MNEGLHREQYVPAVMEFYAERTNLEEKEQELLDEIRHLRFVRSCTA